MNTVSILRIISAKLHISFQETSWEMMRALLPTIIKWKTASLMMIKHNNVAKM